MKLRTSTDRRADERVVANLQKNVRDQRNAAAIAITPQTPLRRRIDRAA